MEKKFNSTSYINNVSNSNPQNFINDIIWRCGYFSIKELPPEEKIKTYLRSDSKRLNVFKFISSQIKKEDKYILSIH